VGGIAAVELGANKAVTLIVLIAGTVAETVNTAWERREKRKKERGE
jgi:hypothetical protein